MSYSFACPFCHAEWKLEELVKVAADVFSSFEGAGTCPQCKGKFSWVEPGTMDGQVTTTIALPDKYLNITRYWLPFKCRGNVF